MSQSAFEKLKSQLTMAIAAGQGGIWLQTREPDEVLRVLSDLSRNHAHDRYIGTWNLVEKLSWWHKKPPFVAKDGSPYPVLTLLGDMLKLCHERNTSDEQIMSFVVVGLLLGHREVLNNQSTNREVLASLLLTAIRGSTACVTTIVMAHPSVPMPPELAEHYAIIEHELPDQDGRAEIIRSLNVEDEAAVTMGAEVLSGLPATQVVSICATSISGYGKLDRAFLTTQKAKAVNKSGLLELYQGQQTFADLGGYKGLKAFCTQIINGAKKVQLHAKGVLLVGVPGTGKSFFAQVLGNELGRPTLALDIGKLYGGIVGATEGNVRSATDTIDAMAPNVFYVDEVEKSFSGVGGGSHDSGVSDRMFGHFLTWMSNRTSDSFMVCTANRVEALPPEFSRSGRFDAVFFMDFPSADQRRLIWGIHGNKYHIDLVEQCKAGDGVRLPFDDSNWTGAEIEDCCRLARIRGVSLAEAAESIVPIYQRYAQVINSLREWADGRCLDAETGKPYKSPGKFKEVAAASTTTRRRVNNLAKGVG